MKIKFLGSGSAFTMKNFQTNAILTADSGKRLLIDAGTDIRFSMREAGLGYKDVDAVYFSHAHADHLGGAEWLAFARFFDKSAGGPPDLFCIRTLMHELWDHSLRGGLESIEGKVMHLTDYFHCHGIEPNESFVWEGITFTPVQTVHIVDGFRFMPSYGLLIETPGGKTVFYSGDSQYAPSQLSKFYGMAGLIFHDCETAPYFSKVHAHYNDLKTLPNDTKSKMWLMHYQDDPSQDVSGDGFAGFVKKGQEFQID